MEYVLSNIVNFLVVIFILYKAGKKPAVEMAKNRSENIKKFIHDAEGEYKTASAEEQKWSTEWNSIEKRVNTLENEAKDVVNQLRDKTMAEARKQAERIESDGKRLAQGESSRAKFELRQRIVEESLALAKSFLDKSLGKGERKKLIADSLELVGNGHTT